MNTQEDCVLLIVLDQVDPNRKSTTSKFVLSCWTLLSWSEERANMPEDKRGITYAWTCRQSNHFPVLRLLYGMYQARLFPGCLVAHSVLSSSAHNS